jgi:predicted nucleic-acid-binding protein
MIGLDTNILLRIFVRDDAQQAKSADAFLARHCTAREPGFVNHIVLCELTWTLEKYYRLSRAEIAEAVDRVLDSADLKVQDRDVVTRALAVFRASKAQFADALIGEINGANGCENTATFDQTAAKLAAFAGVR